MALLGIAHKSIKKGWNRMVGIWQDGDEIKRREMLGLVEKTNSKEYQLLQKWISSSKRLKGVKIVRKTADLFYSINDYLRKECFDALIERKNKQIMVSAIKRMIDNSKCCQEKIFERWKYAVRALKVGDQLTDLQKTQAVSGLLRFNQSASVVLQKKALNKFKINSVICRHQIKFMANCLSTKLGHLQKFHSTWKNMPEKLDKNKINN